MIFIYAIIASVIGFAGSLFLVYSDNIMIRRIRRIIRIQKHLPRDPFWPALLLLKT